MHTPEMTAAERELDARIDHALGVTREAESHLAELEEEEPTEPPNVEHLKAFVLGYARTPEWVAVINRIDDGELTWQQVQDSLYSGRADQGILAAFESLSTVPPPSEEKLTELGLIPATPEPPTPQDPTRRRIITWPNR